MCFGIINKTDRDLTKWTRRAAIAATAYVFVAFLILIGTGYSLYQNDKQLSRNKEQLQLNKDVFSAQYRPWVNVEPIDLTPDSDTYSFIINCKLMNHGIVPAANAVMKPSTWFIDSMPDIDEEVGSETSPSEKYFYNRVFPDSFVNVRIESIEYKEERFNKIVSGSETMIFVLSIEYEDVSGNQYWSSSVCSYNPKGRDMFSILRSEGT